ncbi:MAG: hypothetical protein VYE64_05345 [Planctomycetota bacterium]|nr:hypothetical protein [Planctomycetota bacterium]
MIDLQRAWITFLALVAFIALATSAYTTIGQQPETVDLIGQTASSGEPNAVPSSPNQSETGLIAVNPRDNSIWTQATPGNDSPSSIDKRTLAMLRTGNIDELQAGLSAGQQETIRTRYPNGKVQILKNVMQDERGNFFNHGIWRLFNEEGEVLAEGRFEQGLMEGRWQRWHPAGSGGLFTTEPFNEFQGPFLSSATFSRGELNGAWIVYDQQRRKILEIPYREGKRHGRAIWWYPSSNRMREAQFQDGQLDGSLKEWDRQNRLVRNDEFISGKKIVRNTSYYQPQQKESESYFLDTELELSGEDNWWDAQPASFAMRGDAMQHGPISAWHDNGQLKMKGQYLENNREGQFTWWHQNGQRSLSGTYEEGEKTGLWTWWHANGMKRIQGSYEADMESGNWTWWDEEGQLVSTEIMTPAQSTGELMQPGVIEEIEIDQLLDSPIESPVESPQSPPTTGGETIEEISPKNATSQPNQQLIPQISFEEDGLGEILLEEPRRPEK